MSVFNSVIEYFSKDAIEKAISEANDIQPRLKQDLRNGKKEKAVQYIKETLDSLNVLYEKCEEDNDYKKYTPRIDALRKTYQELITEYGLNIKFKPADNSFSRPNPRLE